MRDLKHSLFIIDASAFIFRAYYALQPLSSKGRPSQAVAGFASMLLKLIREKEPSSLVVVFDSKKPSFRKDIYPEYKANREAPPPDLSGQIEAVMAMCREAKLPILQGEGIEADDWIASLVRQGDPKKQRVIVSSDKDLAQLVDDSTLLYDSFKEKIYGAAEVKEKWGVLPHQMHAYLSLVGDSSDNIPGVDGIGPKGAQKLIEEFGTIKNLWKERDKLPEKMKARIEASKANLDLSEILVSLKMDCDLPWNAKSPDPFQLPIDSGMANFLKDWELTRPLTQFAKELGLEAAPEAAVRSEASSQVTFHCIKNEKNLETLVQACKKAKVFAFDCETDSLDRWTTKVVGISLAFSEREAFYVPLRHQEQGEAPASWWSHIKNLLEDESLEKVAHHSKFDRQVLENEGIILKNSGLDTMIAAHLLHADWRGFSLDAVAHEVLQESKGDLQTLLKTYESFDKVPLEEATKYAARDAWLTWRLYEKFQNEIKEDKWLFWLWSELEKPMIEVLASMERAGVWLDRERLKKLSSEFHVTLDKIEKNIYDLAGETFNINSPKQLQKILFEKLKLEATKKTKTGYSTDESVLEELSIEHPLPRMLLDFRRIQKMLSTYVDVLPEMVSKNGRLHTHYHQTGTATGRLSSSEPNLQNIPTRSEEGKLIREAFKAEGDNVLLSADYSQVELRLFAHFSNDPQMIEAFNRGRDIHSETAKIIFGSEDKEFRSRAKAINFGIIYGISAFGLARQLGISRTEAAQFMAAYFQKFPEIKKTMEENINVAARDGFASTLFGRRRPLPDIRSKNPTLRQLAERMAINSPVQGTAADIMKWAMVRVFESLKSQKLKSQIILQVHDELILEVPQNELEVVKALVYEGMTNLAGTPLRQLRVPLVVDMSHGKSWAEL